MRGDKVLHLKTGRLGVVQSDKPGITVLFQGEKQKVSAKEICRVVESTPYTFEIDWPHFKNIDPLCDTCRYGTVLMCPYLAVRDVIKGLSATGAKAVCCDGGYKVFNCPKYEKGTLPKWGKVHTECQAREG